MTRTTVTLTLAALTLVCIAVATIHTGRCTHADHAAATMPGWFHRASSCPRRHSPRATRLPTGKPGSRGVMPAA